jgi:hypothetical protein
MTLIAGASRFVTAATLSNRGSSLGATGTSLLGQSTVSLLDVGKRFGAEGVGLSGRSRALTKQFLQNSTGLANSLLSAPAEANSIEGLRTQILAIQARTPPSQLSAAAFEKEPEVSDDGVDDSPIDNPFVQVSRGGTVDTTA